MNTLILYNPVAGAGRGRRLAEDLAPALVARGHTVSLVATQPGPPEAWLDAVMEGADVAVVVGGDGAVRMATGPAVRTDTPIYHFPAGTENLFAREFGIDRSHGRIADALERRDVWRLDLGVAQATPPPRSGRACAAGPAQPFLLMASVGFDADVVHDLACTRTGGIHHASYLMPMMRHLISFAPPRVSVEIDGAPFVDDEPGLAIVANCRQYAMRMDPARRASMIDGRLDVVFFPTRSRFDLVGWMIAAWRGRHLANPRLRYGSGERVTLRCPRACRYQLDGDPPACTTDDGDEPVERLDLTVTPGVLPVVVPPVVRSNGQG